MRDLSRCIVVRFDQVGFHRWPHAVGRRAYLADRHRHLFKVEVRLEVFVPDREVEFHDLQEFARKRFADSGVDGEFGHASCEALAQALLAAVSRTYPKREVSVGVYEDGEVGAEVSGRSE